MIVLKYENQTHKNEGRLMKISTEINSAARLVGMQKAVELVGRAGFDAWDFSMFDMCRLDSKTRQPIDNPNELNGPNYLKFARELKKIGEDNGMVCNQSHAPFPVSHRAVYSFIKRAIECTAEAGGEICVVHPDNNKTAEQNAKMYFELLPFAKGCGVKIATENMWNWNALKTASAPAACSSAEDFKRHIDIVNDEYFVACLDIGHAEMRGSGEGAAFMIKELGHRLKALHIHDNDLLRDLHQIPFSMSIDFDAVVKALREIGYSGYLTLEAESFLKSYDEQNAFEGVLKLKESVARLAEKFSLL